MTITSFLFAGYLFLSIYCAGSMTVLQLQHFALYPKVGQDAFRAYINANNKAAVVPAILPAILLLVINVILLISRPDYLRLPFLITTLAMNLVNILSTAIWQGRIHSQLASVGYDAILVDKLVKTNWIRTFALLIQGLKALFCTVNALNSIPKN